MHEFDTLPVPSVAACLEAATDTKFFLNKSGVLAEAPRLLNEAFGNKPVFLIADDNTCIAAGGQLEAIFREGGVKIAGQFLFTAKPVLHAEIGHVGEIVNLLRTALRSAGPEALVPVAVGSGTINDLVKRAAHELGLPYLCVATAASVDGYTSAGAALLADGYKQTFPCAAPRAVLADSAILAAAPPVLTASGWGDLAGKIIAGTDWIIAAAAGDAALGDAKAPGTEAIDPLAWSMTQSGLRATLRSGATTAQAGTTGNEIIDALFQALALTGFSMQYLDNSRPVSGCEHLFAHTWEMADLTINGIPVTHGFKVAIGTLIATAFTERLFASAEPPRLGWVPPTADERGAEINRVFIDSPALEAIRTTALGKLPDPRIARRRQEALADRWKDLRREVLDRLWPYAELRELFAVLGCPVVPSDIGLDRSDAIATALKAQMLRQRYTVLDLAWDFGRFPAVLAEIEADQRYCR